jgi:2-methylcitrate dehydratase PrpD
LTDPRIVEFTKKVTAAKDEKCEQRMIAYLNSGQPKGKLMTQVHYTVEVDSTKGTFTDTAEYIYGDTYDPEHRLSRDALKEKFANNVSSIVDTKTTTELIEAIYRLESFDSIDEFVGLFE